MKRNILPMVHYGIIGNLQVMAWVYGFAFGLPLVLYIGFLLFGNPGVSASINGSVDFATGIAIFVFFLCFYRIAMRMGIQNGMGRSSVLYSVGITLVSAAAMYAVGNTILNRLGRLWFSDRTVGDAIFGNRGPWVMMLYIFCTFLSLGACGAFLSAMYWRIGKIWALVISIGVPVLLIWLVSVAVLNQGSWLYRLFAWAVGVPSNGSGLLAMGNQMVTSLIIALLFSVGTAALARKVVVRS